MAMRKLKNQHRIVYNWKSQHFVAGTSGSRNIGTTDYKSSRCIPTFQKRRISASKFGKVNIYIVLYIACNYLFTKRQIVSSYNRKYFYLFGCFRCFAPPKLNWQKTKNDNQIYHAYIIMIGCLGFYSWLPANDENRNCIYVWVYDLHHYHMCPRRDKLWGPRLNI